MDEIAFLDASPLILLASSARIDLLRCAARRIVVPAAVRREVLARGSEDPTARALAGAAWIEAGECPTVPDRILARDLGEGESAVLALAVGTRRSVAVIDDLAARLCAADLGVKVVGTVGLVVRAKRLGWLRAARPLLLELRSGGMYLSDAVLERALREIGE